MICEVFLDYGVDVVLFFYGSFGFCEVGQNMMLYVDVCVSMLFKDLCSYQWVYDIYGDQLFDVFWVGYCCELLCV